MNTMTATAVKSIKPLGQPWFTSDPFLFCMYHCDRYPAGNGVMGPQASLAGRNIGQDFTLKDGWRMYHGERVPGFPAHPHRGFETVTVVEQGLVDHADSMGAAGRYGNGDTQWLTTGKGVQHSEMFPLLNSDGDNPLELFQIWLNLPRAGKMVAPHFTMFWAEAIPKRVYTNRDGCRVMVEVIAGALDDVRPLAPPPDSWAADPNNHVAIWTIRMAPDASWSLPAAVHGIHRTLYYYQGSMLTVDGVEVAPMHGVELHPDREVVLANGDQEGRVLLLQGRPINEPVAHYGPFVMNTRAELQQAFVDYQQNAFGGWPWPAQDQIHPRERRRFARHADGREETGSDLDN